MRTTRQANQKFIATIEKANGLFYLTCSIRDEDPDILCTDEPVAENPPGPLESEGRLKELAEQIARVHGFGPAEIIWEVLGE